MTLPASPPISIVDLANETRNTAGGFWLSHDDVKRLLGLRKSNPGPITLMDCLGKSRPWWGLVPVSKVLSGSTTFYTWLQAHGGLDAAVDPYFGNVPITAIQSTVSALESGSILSFDGDPGFRNNIKAQLLDSDFGIVREVVYSYDAVGTYWRSAQLPGGDTSTCLFLSEGNQFVNLIKL